MIVVIAVGIFVLTRGGDDDSSGTPVAGVSGTGTSTSGSILGLATATPDTSGATTPAGQQPATMAPTNTSAAVEPTSTSESTDEPTDTPEDEEPTSEPVESDPEPTATEPTQSEIPEAPAEGDFGQLPAVQIVSGGLSRNFELTYDLQLDLSAMPTSGAVYQLLWSALDEDTAAGVVAAILPDATLTEQGEGWQASGSGGSISLQAGSVQFVGVESDATDIPDDESAIQAASDWLLTTGLAGGNLREAGVIARDDDFGRVVVQVKPADPTPLLAFLPSATITVGLGGTVVEANVRWPSDLIPADYTLRTGDQVWNDVLAGRGAIEADLSSLAPSGALSAEIGINDVTLAWSYASGENGEFLIPVVAFHGTLTILETGEQVPVSIYLPAVASEESAQG